VKKRKKMNRRIKDMRMRRKKDVRRGMENK
jgi:hypothetical protein